MNLMRGQRVKLSDLTPQDQFTISLKITAPDLTIDYSCFGLDAQDKLSDDRYMTFYNQSKTPCGGICLGGALTQENTSFLVNLKKLPDHIRKLVVTAAIDGQGVMSEINQGDLKFIASRNLIANFNFQGSDFEKERALMLIELYFKDGQWRINALAQGFNGGLDALVKHFGGEVSDPVEEIVLQPDSLESSFSGAEQENVLQNSGGLKCIRCHKKIGIVGRFLGFHVATSRCSKCENEVKAEISRVRQKFLSYISDGVLSKAEWQSVKDFSVQRNVNWDEFFVFIQDDILSFLERTLSFYASDGIITEEENEEFNNLCRLMEVPSSSLVSLLGRLSYLKEITKIRKGELKVIQTNAHLESDELCYLETSAVYQKVTQKGITQIPGRFLASNKKLHFISNEGGFTIQWKNVIGVRQESIFVILELSTKQGNGCYKVEDPLLAEAVLTTLTKISKRQLLCPSEDVQTRRISSDVKIAVWQRDQGRCVQCNSNSYLEFDHVIPFSKGGANTVNNIQLLCRKCNLAKGDRL